MASTVRSTGSGPGFTLIEVVVSGVILAVVIYGLFAFVSQANAIARNGILRQRGFQVVNRVLASRQFSHDHIDTLYDSCLHNPNPLNYPRSVSLLGPLVRIDTLDERSISTTTDDIFDTVVVLVDTLLCDFQTHLDTVPAIRVRASARWTDYNGIVDSAWLEKVITRNRG